MMWDLFIDDDDGHLHTEDDALPGSLGNVGGDATSRRDPPPRRPPPARVPSRRLPITAQFAPSRSEEVTFTGEIARDSSTANSPYYEVEFRVNHLAIFQSATTQLISVGDYVLTEADRGLDIGRVISIKTRVPAGSSRTTRIILRHANPSEVEQLPEKDVRERRALQIGQEKVTESGLPILLTGAEFQFDGKKLTFYFSASHYIDFRMLVRTLFRVFGCRIWMVWNEEHDHRKPQ
jgi:hypothetical protein